MNSKKTLYLLSSMIVGEVSARIFDQFGKEYVNNRYPFIADFFKDNTPVSRSKFFNELSSMPENKQLLRLYKICGDHRLALRLTELCLTCIIVPQLEQAIDELYDSGLTMELCEKIWHEGDYLYSYKEERERAKQILLVTDSAHMHMCQTFAADDVIFDFVSGANELDDALKFIAKRFNVSDDLQKLYINEEKVDEILGLLTQCKLLQITGSVGGGRKLLLKHAGKKCGKPILFIDAKKLLSNGSDRLTNTVYRIRREVLLHEYMLCFYNIETANDEMLDTFTDDVLGLLEQTETPICVVTSPGVHLLARSAQTMKIISIEDPTRTERAMLWSGYGDQYGVEGIDWLIIGNKIKMTAQGTQKVLEQLAMRKDDNAPSERDVMEACNNVLPPAQGDFHAVNNRFVLDDLKVSDATKEAMNNICSHVLHRHKVYDEWDLESKFSYGKSVSALFVGAPGTGKTMAVHVISNMLNIPIFQVDLSQVVDKYIGETEKHLERIFDRAESTNTILFFDEADSIFGKRSDVSEAKDKFANTQVSYILQRLEQYDGIVILATNFRQNVDDAVMRRIRYLVEFQFPNEETRRMLWQSAFAEKTPLEDVDFDFLAFRFELAGGSIKNIALNAAFLAAKEDSAITMRHILICVKEESKKLGKAMLKQDFGKYGEMVF